MDPPPRKPYHLPADSVWFITGCSSGIGQALAQLVASKGHRLVATARKVAALSYLPEDDAKVLKVSLDVSTKASVDAAVAATLARFGRLDVAVNSAGYSLFGDAENATEEQAHEALETMFFGTMRVTQHATRIMREENPKSGQQGGAVVNITSMGARVAYPGNSLYHAAKFAVEGFTEAISKELRPDWNINYCLIEPGGVKTNYATTSAKLIEQHPAYAAPDMPTRILASYIFENPAIAETWASPHAVAGAIYEIISRGKPIPLRHPLCPDAWQALKDELPKYEKNLEETRELAFAVGKEGQLESLSFMKANE